MIGEPPGRRRAPLDWTADSLTAATHVLRQSSPDTSLKRHGRQLAKGGSPRDKARARIAVARKLAIVMHRLWLTGEVYQPLPAKESTA